MKTTMLVGLLAAMLAVPAAGALIGATLTTETGMLADPQQALIDEDIDFEPEIAELLGCDGLHVSVSEEGDANAHFYNWVEDEETGELVKEECDPLGEGLLGASILTGVSSSAALIDEDIDFPPEAAELIGCDGLHVSASEEGDAAAYLYNWVEDEETGELVKEECDPAALAMLATAGISAAAALIDEDVDFPPELAEAIGCDGAHASVSEEGDAAAYFYNWVEDEETGELVKEECDPLA